MQSANGILLIGTSLSATEEVKSQVMTGFLNVSLRHSKEALSGDLSSAIILFLFGPFSFTLKSWSVTHKVHLGQPEFTQYKSSNNEFFLHLTQ